MGQLATPLALAELSGTVAIVVLLVVAMVWKRQLLTTALVVAIVFGIVLANPFGVVAEPSTVDARSLTPTVEADGARHWVKLAGIPVAWFTPYDQPYPWAGAFENSPDSVLKLRYGLAFLPATGATSVVEQCSNSINDPCWSDRTDDHPLVSRDERGHHFVVPLTQTLVPNRQGDSIYANVPHVYETRLGVASWRGVGYWAFLGLVLVFVLSIDRLVVRWRAVGIGAAGCLVAGVALGGVAAVLPEPVRSASSTPLPLLPEPVTAPVPSGSIDPIPIASYPPACIVTDNGAASNRCERIADLTAAPTPDGALAVWTAGGIDGLVHLRVRRLSHAGEPLDGTVTVASWDVSASPGGWNCAIPAELQSAPLRGGTVLVAWSSECDLHGSGGPASITGLVLSPTGTVVREPFRVLAWDRGSTAEPAPRYWLRSTTAGEALLFWEAPSLATPPGRGLFVSRLNAYHQSVDPRQVFSEEHGIGSVAVACDRACFVVQGLGGRVTTRVLDSSGRVVRTSRVSLDSKKAYSEVVAAAAGDRYYAGWLESDGTNTDGHLAALDGTGGAPVVRTVTSLLPAGDGVRGTTLTPLGIALRHDPALVFQAPAVGVDDELLLHVASPRDVTSRSMGLGIGEPSIVGRVLVAVAGVWPGTPAEPVSITLW